MFWLTNASRSAEPSRSRQQLPAPTQAAWIVLAVIAVIALFAAGSQAKDFILYNHSPSMPVGLFVRTRSPVERDAIVTVRALDVAGDYARERGFAGEGDRFIKRVVAASGDTVCAEGGRLTLNGVVAAHRQDRDSAGHALPSWFGCRRLARDEVLLLGDTADSFDGRYWGVVSFSLIEGVWRPLIVNSDQNE